MAVLRPKSPWMAQAVAAAAFLLLYLPLAVIVVTSFLVRQEPGQSTAWTLEWYRKAWANTEVVDALRMSLLVGLWSTLGAVILGTTAALSLVRNRFHGRGAFDALIHVPLIMPEVVLALSMLIWFVLLRIALGAFSIILAHVTFSVSYVIMTVRARLHGFDPSLEEAARDLGASSSQVFWRVTFPLVLPGVVSGALMAFTLSLDDFLITFFTAGVGSDTLPLKIYSMIKFGVSPEINALSTVMLVATFALVMFFFRPSRPGKK